MILIVRTKQGNRYAFGVYDIQINESITGELVGEPQQYIIQWNDIQSVKFDDLNQTQEMTQQERHIDYLESLILRINNELPTLPKDTLKEMKQIAEQKINKNLFELPF